jgi:hypothetical protein
MWLYNSRHFSMVKCYLENRLVTSTRWFSLQIKYEMNTCLALDHQIDIMQNGMNKLVKHPHKIGNLQDVEDQRAWERDLLQ